MKCKLGLLGLILFIFIFQTQAADTTSIRLIVKYKKSPPSLLSLQTQLKQITGLSVDSLSPMAGGAYSVRFNIPSSIKDLQQHSDPSEILLRNLRKNPDVLYAVKDRVGYFKPLPETESRPYENVLSHDVQWDEFTPPAGIMLESAPGRRDGAWAYTTGQAKKPVVVAVLDTGVESNDSLMPNLIKDKNGNIWGWNFAGNNRNLSDETASYHGTHVSGTIAGYGDVMMGMGEHLKVLTVKIPDASGMFYESSVINGIYWAVGGDVPGIPENPYPAKVLNMSFGVDEGPGKEIDHCDEALQEAIKFARSQGAVIVVAAGNDNRWEHYNAPAVCNGTVKVASTGPEGYRAYYSNYGPGVTLAAPGGDKRYGDTGGILSTVNPGGGYHHSGFAFYQGTSMASPHVAGVAGLLFAINDSLLPQDIEQILYTTTHDFGQTEDSNRSCVGKKPCGHGILDAESAVLTALTGYELLLYAPSISESTLASCSNGLFKPAKEKIEAKNAVWEAINTSCESADDFRHPLIQQMKDGKILAFYGKTTYQLDQSGFKKCQVIGYDGVGCFH
ncbi:S8 family serine peptidase [Legionella israelensis]|uniref:S8 family serine peptidase n=1 Tax=Legionella israelensis TaxID=454 RepID=UPI001180E7AB|nr:S8 family serine peptidase [Legionella israelensis]QDP72254.1 S8 family serine peptidase [Legionella israelensis]